MISLVIFLVTCLLTAAIGARFRDLLSPLSVMVIVWGVSLSLYYLKLIYYIDLHLETLALIILGLFSFAAGFLIVSRHRHVQQTKSDAGEDIVTPAQRLRETVNANRFFILCMILFVLGMIGQIRFLNKVDEVVGLSYAVDNPEVLHFATAVGDLKRLEGLGVLASTNLVNTVVLLSYLVLFGRKRNLQTMLVSAALLFSIAAVLFRTSRTGVFIPAIWSVVMYFYLVGGLRIRLRSLVFVFLALSVLLAVFLGIAGLIGKIEAAEVYRLYWQSSLPFNRAFASLYFYGTSAIPAFQVFVDSTHEFLGGRSTFLPFLRAIQLVVPDIELVDTVRPYVFVPLPTNVFTGLAPFYEDFGVGGIILFSLAFGCISAFFYRRMKERPSLALVLFASLLTTTIFWSAFQSIIIFIVIWYYAVVAIAVGLLVTRRSETQRVARHEFKWGSTKS